MASSQMAASTSADAIKPWREVHRACNECKQQKMKCTSHVDYPNPCSRCRRLQLSCKFSDNFKRVAKHRKLQQHTPRPKASDAVLRKDGEADLLHPGSEAQPCLSDQGSAVVHPPIIPVNTCSRSLGEVQIDRDTINELFLRFFGSYAIHLPILDSNMAPNAYYFNSPLLFWTIISVAYRRGSKDPELLGKLAPLVLDLVWSSIRTTIVSIPNIQALLILSTWSFPASTVFKDMTFLLSGMAVNLALQAGLHVPLQSEDFTLSKLKLSQDDFRKRTKLWLYCLLVREKATSSLGYPPLIKAVQLQKSVESCDLGLIISESVRFQLKLLSISTQANEAIFDFNVSNDKHSSIILLEVVEAQCNQLQGQLDMLTVLEEYDSLWFHITRLQVCIHHFSEPLQNVTVQLLRVCNDAQAIVRILQSLDESMEITASCPTYIYLMLGLSICVFLRLQPQMASFQSDHHDLGDSFSTAINLLRQISIEKDDVPDRLATAFTHLWQSSNKSDGSIATVASRHPNVRSRLSMSLFYNCLRWWRVEFGGQPPTASDVSTSTTISNDSGLEPLGLLDPGIPGSAGFIDFNDLLSLSWNPGDFNVNFNYGFQGGF